MYKAKYQIWLLVLGISFVMFLCSLIKFEDTITYNLNSSLDSEFINRFDGYKKKNAKITVINSNTNNDIIIEKASDKTIDGYTKYPKQFYSEFLIYLQVGEYCGTSCEFYDEIEANINAFYKIIDLKTLLEAIEENKTYADLGLINTSGTHSDANNKLKMNEKIILNIPGKGLHYHYEAINLLKYALNDYSYENFDDKDLNERLEKILLKCSTYNSDKELSTRIFNKTLENNRHLFLAPSYIRDSAMIDKSPESYYYYVNFLPSKTTNVYYDLYIKDIEDMSHYDKLLNSLKYDNFFDHTGLKNVEINFDKYYLFLDRLN